MYGEDLAEEMRQQDQAYKMGRGLAPRRFQRRPGPNLNVTYPPAARGRGQYQYGHYQQYQQQQYQYQPRFQGNFSFRYSPSLYWPQFFNSTCLLNRVVTIDDRCMPQNVLQLEQTQNRQTLNVNQAILFSSSATVPRPGTTPAGSQTPSSTGQRQRSWQLDPQTEPDRSVTPVSTDYPYSLGIVFTDFSQGGVEKKVQNWQTLTSDPRILDLVRGVKLDFMEPPQQDKIPHEIKFSAEESILVQQELDRFVNMGILAESTIQPGDFVSNLFTRPKKEPGKLRILANLKQLNLFVRHVHFKMETLESILSLVKPNSYMVSIDLESSFYALKVHPDYTRYLKVICQGKVYVFLRLPMGYAQSPLIFTQLMKVPLTYLRTEYGYTNAAFVDDLFLVEDTFDLAEKSSIHTVETVQFLGYTVNVPKSGIKPQQKKEHLGMIINSVTMTVTLTTEKVDKLINHAQNILSQDRVQIRSVASLIGQMNAARLAVKYGPLHTKSLEIAKNAALIKSAGDFDQYMILSSLDKMDIKWWIETCPKASKSLLTPPIDYVIFTDASLSGYGFHLQGTEMRGGGRWSDQEALLHINVLEIKSILLSLLALFPKHNNIHVKIFCDSQVAIQCVKKEGSTKSLPCNTATRNLLLHCEKQNIDLSLAHIPGAQNIVADQESRHFKNPDTEWQLNQDIYHQICSIVGFEPEIDLFAERLNSKCAKYCSWELDPYATHIDAFSVDWNQYMYLYSFCPFSMISRVLHQFQTLQPEKRLLLIVPVWRTQAWWTIIMNHLVQVPIVFKVKQNTLTLAHEPNKTHPMIGKLTLMAAVLSTDILDHKVFLDQFQPHLPNLEQRLPTNSTRDIFRDGRNFVSRGRLIPSNLI